MGSITLPLTRLTITPHLSIRISLDASTATGLEPGISIPRLTYPAVSPLHSVSSVQEY